MSGGAIERVVTRVWGRGRRAAEATPDHRAQLLELCMLVQHATHVWGPWTDEPLCINPAGVDYFWRAVLVLVRDGLARDEALRPGALKAMTGSWPNGPQAGQNGKSFLHSN